MIKQKKDSVTIKRENLKLYTQRKKGYRMRENEESLCEILDTVKQHNVHIVAVPKEEKEKEAESLLKEIMAEKLAKSGERDGYSP